MSNPDFTTTSQAQCVAWYVETVGTPSWTTLTLDQLRLIRKAQMNDGGRALSSVQQFYSLLYK